jgi:hypothetical protein
MVGFWPKAPVTLIPELEELDADPDADPDAFGEDEPLQAARAEVTSRPAVSTRAAERAEGRNERADSFTRNLRLLGAGDPTTVRAESDASRVRPLHSRDARDCGTIGGVSGEHRCVST